MTYTLWSHGRLLGESPLNFPRCLPRLRTGALQTTPHGQCLLARVADTRSDALFAAQELHHGITPAAAGGAPHATSPYATISADLTAADHYLNALDLELRRHDGSVIPTERIDVTDTEFVIAFGALEDELTDEPAFLPNEADELHVSFDPETDIDDPDADNDDKDLLEDLDAIDLVPDGWQERPEGAPSRFQLEVILLDEGDIP